MIFSEGIITKMIDYEYTHVEGMDDYEFDAKLDLCRKGYNSGLFDPGYDCLRFVISTLTYYSALYHNDWIKNIRNSICEFFNTHSEGKINNQGVLNVIRDSLKDKILKHDELKNLSSNKKKFLQSEYYSIIGLLTHKLKYPLKRRIGKPDIWSIAVFFRIFLSPNIEFYEKLLRPLYILIQTDNQDKAIKYSKLIGISDNDVGSIKLWIATLHKSINDCLLHLETELSIYMERISQKRKEANTFSPITMIKWLYTYCYSQSTLLTNDFDVIWMDLYSKKTLSLRNAPFDSINSINHCDDIFQKSQKLKLLLSSFSQ